MFVTVTLTGAEKLCLEGNKLLKEF